MNSTETKEIFTAGKKIILKKHYLYWPTFSFIKSATATSVTAKKYSSYFLTKVSTQIYSIIHCEKRLQKIGFCRSEIQISRGKYLLTSFKCLL